MSKSDYVDRPGRYGGAAAALRAECEINLARRAAEERADQYQAVADARERAEREERRTGGGRLPEGVTWGYRRARANNELWLCHDEFTLDDRGELVYTKLDPPLQFRLEPGIWPPRRRRIYWPFWLSIIAIVITLWVMYVLSCGATLADPCRA